MFAALALRVQLCPAFGLARWPSQSPPLRDCSLSRSPRAREPIQPDDRESTPRPRSDRRAAESHRPPPVAPARDICACAGNRIWRSPRPLPVSGSPSRVANAKFVVLWLQARPCAGRLGWGRAVPAQRSASGGVERTYASPVWNRTANDGLRDSRATGIVRRPHGHPARRMRSCRRHSRRRDLLGREHRVHGRFQKDASGTGEVRPGSTGACRCHRLAGDTLLQADSR